jgi:hypothetical protein
VDEVGCHTSFVSRLISIFVFDILQIAGGCIYMCSMCILPTCNALATGHIPARMCTKPQSLSRVGIPSGLHLICVVIQTLLECH